MQNPKTLTLQNVWGMSPLNARLILCYNVGILVTRSAVELTTLICYTVWGCLIRGHRASCSSTPTEKVYDTPFPPNIITK
jgi:hypothetical protein